MRYSALLSEAISGYIEYELKNLCAPSHVWNAQCLSKKSVYHFMMMRKEKFP